MLKCRWEVSGLLATLERIELVEEAELLAKMIINSEIATHYRNCYQALQDNTEAQTLIRQFIKIKEHYEEVQRFGKYHPNYSEIMKETRILKREVDLHPAVDAFKKAEKQLQELLDEISILIGRSVSEYIKVPTGNPFFDSMSCGGGCGSGGSCGCK
ncbi:YlbF family regulator [Bacillus salitolerans]|uniref:YlbF family regulator n=1 Tax=Bacillus salitolerans TaxID=1437434 RepID=A0ABW4LKV7_9BACI